MSPRERLEKILASAIRRVEAGRSVERALPAILDPHDGPLVVLGLGKAALPMARTVADAAGDRVRRGLVVTREGHGGRVAGWPVRETAHPVPDARCEAAAREALELAAETRDSERLLVLLSGGTSSLTACPAEGLDLPDLAVTTRALLGCGADIDEVNCVRKHLSDFAGGRLARAAGAGRIEVLVVSDVLGDRLDTIGSGPCAPDPTSFADAVAVIDRYALRAEVPGRVLKHLLEAADETPKPGERIFERVRHTIVARNADAIEAATRAAGELGLEPLVVEEPLSGEARDQALRLLEVARGADRGRPRCLIAGGETTVTVRGSGRGGRSQELALAAAVALAERPEPAVSLLAAGTDGNDGETDAAGAFVDPGTVARGAAAGQNADRALADNDSYGFFQAEGGLVRTGPTDTNVMDLVLAEL